MIPVPPDGPVPANVMIVGEAPGEEEERRRTPFCGASGMELNRMLQEAGIMRNLCFVTNVCRIRPPANDISSFIPMKKKDITTAHIQIRDKHVLPVIKQGIDLLEQEINLVRPKVIIAVGNTSMWALTGQWGIKNWRGSMLREDLSAHHTKVIPTYHPAAVLREWSLRAVSVTDFRRAAKFMHGAEYPEINWNFVIRPLFEQAVDILQSLLNRLLAGETLRLSVDIETRNYHIACIGISWSLKEAICIPFAEKGKGHYWSEEEETVIIYLLYKLLTHPNAQVVGQNFLYDAQYIYRHWHFIPNLVQDTMISQHALFSDLPKSLAFQASMYCSYYRFWKDEGKNI